MAVSRSSEKSACRKILTSTTTLAIHEDSPHNYYWGWRNNGEDMLGKILVRVRDEIVNKLTVRR